MTFFAAMQTIAGPADRQIWKLPATLNFILGGNRPGSYIIWILYQQSDSIHVSASGLAGLLTICLVVSGFAAVSLEAGRPSRARYLLSHWNRSWMSREALAGIVFVSAVVFDLIFSLPSIQVVAVISASVLLLSQAMIVYRCSAVPVWHDLLVPVSFILAGLYSGYGLFLLLQYNILVSRATNVLLVDLIAIGCLIINTIIWIRLFGRKRENAVATFSNRFFRALTVTSIVGVGQLLPIILLLWVKFGVTGVDDKYNVVMGAVAAVVILAGNCIQKWWLVSTRQYLCGMQLNGEKCN